MEIPNSSDESLSEDADSNNDPSERNSPARNFTPPPPISISAPFPLPQEDQSQDVQTDQLVTKTASKNTDTAADIHTGTASPTKEPPALQDPAPNQTTPTDPNTKPDSTQTPTQPPIRLQNTAANPAPTPEEAAFSSLRERKITALQTRTSALESELAELRGRLGAVTGELREKDAAATVRRHIRLLHEYNEMRDVGQGLLGMIAEQRGCRVRELYEEFGVGVDD